MAGIAVCTLSLLSISAGKVAVTDIVLASNGSGRCALEFSRFTVYGYGSTLYCESIAVDIKFVGIFPGEFDDFFVLGILSESNLGKAFVRHADRDCNLLGNGDDFLLILNRILNFILAAGREEHQRRNGGEGI